MLDFPLIANPGKSDWRVFSLVGPDFQMTRKIFWLVLKNIFPEHQLKETKSEFEEEEKKFVNIGP